MGVCPSSYFFKDAFVFVLNLGETNELLETSRANGERIWQV